MMLRRRSIMLLSFITLIGRSGAADPQQLRPPSLERSLVVSGQGYFPVALRLQDGRIAVVLRGGAPHLGIQGRLDIVFSADEGKTWSRPSVVADSPVDDRNPAFGQAADGTLVVAFWRTANYDEQGRYNPKLNKPINTWVTRSQDGGKTWSPPAEIDVADIGWGSPYGRILDLPDGSLLMNIYGGSVRRPGGPAAEGEENSYLYRSLDQGKSWKRHAQPGAKRFNETALLRLLPNRLLAAMRTKDGGEVWLTESRDDGTTWSDPHRITPTRVHPADLTLLADGRLLLVTGYRVGPFGVRGLVGRPARGFDWEQHFVLVNDATSSDCGYPSTVVLKDGRLLTVYYAVGSKEHSEWGVHCGAVIYQPPRER